MRLNVALELEVWFVEAEIEEGSMDEEEEVEEEVIGEESSVRKPLSLR